MHVNWDAKRPSDSPIGQNHVVTVTVCGLERQLGFVSWIGYTSHHAIRILATDIIPGHHGAVCPCDPFRYAGSSSQVWPIVLSWGCLDVRPLTGEDGMGL